MKNIVDNEDENKQTYEKKQQQQQHKSRVLADDDSKLKVTKANTSKLGNKSQIHRQPTLTEPKSPNFSFKPRQRSVLLII